MARVRPELDWQLDQGSFTFGIKGESHFIRAMEPYNLWGTESLMKAPLLCIFAEDDLATAEKTFYQGIYRYLKKVNCTVDVHLFTREEGISSHCQAMGGMPQAQALIFRWLNQVFMKDEIKPSDRSSPRIRIPDNFLHCIGRYFGNELADQYRCLQKQEQP
jgi:hypothetical protein